jgi:flagellar export protein FliJ
VRRFDFPLERLRLWRQKQLEAEEEKLRRLLAEAYAMEAELRRLASEEEAAVRAVMELAAVTVEQLSWVRQWREYARRETRRLNACLAELQHRIEDQKQLVLEAYRRIESLDQLKQRQFAEWAIEAGKEEQAAVEELVVSRWRPG